MRESDMPQPLSSKFRNGVSYNTDPQAMTKRPELAVKYARCLASWSTVEVELATMMCEAMKAAAGPFAAAYHALNSTAAQASVADAAIRETVEAKLLPIFDAIMSQFRSAKKDRDKLAHGVWAFSDELPDSLLMIDPKLLVRREAAFIPNYTLSEISPNTRGGPCGPEHAITPAMVMVYDDGDFDRIIAENHKVKWMLKKLGWCVWTGPPEAEKVYQSLLSEPKIQEWIARQKPTQSLP